MRYYLWKWVVIIGMMGSIVGCSTVPKEDERMVPPVDPPVVASAPTILTATIEPTPTEPPVTALVPTFTPAPTSELPLPVPTQVPDGVLRIANQVVSPDGQWMATTMYTDFDVQGPIAGTFTLTNLQTNEEMLLENLVVAEGKRWLEEVPLPIGWRADSQVFYYTYFASQNDGCVLPLASPLHQYTLATATHDILSTPVGNGHQFSPTSEQVAYFPIRPADAPPAIAVYTPATHVLQEIPFPEFEPSLAFIPEVTGEMLWHPDGTTIALAVQTAHCTNPTPALLVVDLLTSEIRVVEVGVHFYTLDRWEGNILFLHGYRLLRQYDIEAEVWVGE